MISRAGTAVADPARLQGAARPRETGVSFQALLDGARQPDPQLVQAPMNPEVRAQGETCAVRADTTVVLAVYRAAETARVLHRAVRLDLDTGSGRVSVHVASENGRLLVHVHPDAKVPPAIRASIAEAVRRRAPGAEVRDRGRRPR